MEWFAARGVPMALASASSIRDVQAAMTRLGLWDKFRAVLTCDEYGSKQGPAIYQVAAEKLGAAPACTAVFEDSLQALRTAHEAGFLTVMVDDEASREDWPQMEALADARLHRLTDWPL